MVRGVFEGGGSEDEAVRSYISAAMGAERICEGTGGGELLVGYRSILRLSSHAFRMPFYEEPNIEHRP